MKHEQAQAYKPRESQTGVISKTKPKQTENSNRNLIDVVRGEAKTIIDWVQKQYKPTGYTNTYIITNQ